MARRPARGFVEWRALRADGIDAWTRRHWRHPEQTVVSVGVALASAGIFALSVASKWLSEDAGSVLLVAWLMTCTLVAFAFCGRAQSLRYDGRAADAVRVADALGVAVPEHPPWWKEPRGRRRIPVSLALAAVAASAATVLVRPVPVAAFFVAFIWGVYSWVWSNEARTERCRAFARRMGDELDAQAGTGLRRSRAELVADIADLEREAATKREQLAALDRSAGVHGVTLEVHKLRDMWLAKSEQAEHRGRTRDIALTGFSLIAGLLLGVLAHKLHLA